MGFKNFYDLSCNLLCFSLSLFWELVFHSIPVNNLMKVRSNLFLSKTLYTEPFPILYLSFLEIVQPGLPLITGETHQTIIDSQKNITTFIQIKQKQPDQAMQPLKFIQKSQPQSSENGSSPGMRQTMEWFSERGISNGDTQKMLDNWKIIQKRQCNSNIQKNSNESARHSKSEVIQRRMKKQLTVKIN